ncbi:MAG: acetolactate decarboxylase [Solirubrobacterales bacterium]
MIDELWLRSLHVSSIRHRELHPEHEDHVVFQASTIGALLEGSFEGDVAIAELAEHGDLGVGTLNHLDGELVVVDGDFLRADASGSLAPVDPRRLTPFAAVAWFRPQIELTLPPGAGMDELAGEANRLVPDHDQSLALRIEGRFQSIRGRSVPRQEPPYRPLPEVIEQQTVFEAEDVDATLVGFRFPDQSTGLEAAGFHLHFATADRRRGGHVFGFRTEGEARGALDTEAELRVELPPGVELEAPSIDDELSAALGRVEGGGAAPGR